jgi:hypothetical protein
MPEAWNDDIERLGKQAAEHYHPDADAPDWQLIEQKLDLLMPVEKKKRRRAIFFWLLAGIGLFIAYGVYEMNQPEALPITKPSSIKALDEQVTKIAESDNHRNTMSTKAQNNSAPFFAPALPSALQDKKETTDKKVLSVNTQINTPPVVQATTVFTGNTSINTDTSSTTSAINASALTDDTILTAQSNRTEQKQLIAEQHTDSSSAHNSLKNKNIDTLIHLTDSSTASAKQEEPKTTRKNPSKWEIGLVYGMDASTVKFKYWDQPGTNVGLFIGIPLSSKWSLRTGAIFTRKQYKVAGEDYTLKTYWPNAKLYWVNGYCDMWEIPVQVKYTAKPEKQWTWFASAGLSSYLMKKENYNYYVSINNGQPYIRHAAYDSSSNYLLGIAGFSAGVRARIHERLFVEIEPFARIPLRGVGAGNIKLLSAGVYTSLVIRPFNQKKKH